MENSGPKPGLLPAVQAAFAEPAHLTGLLSTLLGPVALLWYVIAAWSFLAAFDYAGEFFVEKGPFSNALAWLALGMITQFAATRLQRTFDR